MTAFISRTVRSTVGKNVVFLGMSAAAKGISSIAFILLAVRALEPEETGKVILAFLLTRIALNVAGVGLARYLARESAHDPEATNALTLDVQKLIFSLLPLGLVVSVAVAVVDPEWGLAAALIVVSAVFGSSQQSLGGTFLGRERTYLDSLAETAGGLALVLGALAVTLLERGPTAYLAVVAGSRVLAAAVALAAFVRLFRPVASLAGASVGRAFRQGLPYMLNAGSSFVFLRADILLLGVISGTQAVAIYGGVADPLVTMGATISIVNVAFLPSLASAGAERPRLAGRMIALDFVFGVTLAIILAATAEAVADGFFGRGESESVEILRVLCFGLALRFVNNGLATWLTAAGHQWRRTAIAIAAGTFNISVNLVTISIWGYWAAVWVTLATECLILGLSLVALRSEMSPQPSRDDAERVGSPVVEGYGIGPE